MLGGGCGPTLARREENPLLEVIPCGSQALHRAVDTGFLPSAVREGSQKPGSRPRDTVDVDLVIGPRVQGPPTAASAILPVLKDLCNGEWTSRGSKNLCSMPWGSGGQNKRRAQSGIGPLLATILSNSIVSRREIMTRFLSRIRQKTLPRRPP